MAQPVVSWFVCNGRFKVHAVNAIGRCRGRIIEMEDMETGERVHDSAQRMLRLVDTLSAMSGAFGHSAEWIPEPPSGSGRTKRSPKSSDRNYEA
jgi:hypothetical protein